MITNPVSIAVRNPRTGDCDYQINPPTAEALAEHATFLRLGQQEWAAKSVDQRSAVMLRWAAALDAHRESLIAAETLDTGRFRLSREMVDATIANVRTWAERAPGLVEAAERQGQSTVMPHVRFRSQLSPYSLIGVISPWNHPLFLSTIDAIPALLAGCAVLVKTSEIAPRFADPLMDAIRSVPELSRVFAVVQGGPDTGQQLIEQVDALCFTGSVPTGRKVAEACARRFIPVFLELGGKDAVVVTESADIDRAVQSVLRGGVFATGQICHAVERVYVQQKKYDAFVARLVEEAEKLKLAYPTDAQGHIGPFIMGKQAAIVDAQLDSAVAAGARILTGGKSETLGGGVYMRPTVVVDVSHQMDIMTEETFGPVIPVMPYQSEEEAVKLANDSRYGLSGAVIAGTEQEALKIGEQINAGGITLQDTTLTNAIIRDAEKNYFGLSGMGESRMGPSAIMRYFRRKVLIVNTGDPVPMASLAEDPITV